MSDNFYLSWESYKTTFISSFKTFKQEDYLYDVTLVTDDERHVPAHKIILAAASDFFKKLLATAVDNKPMIFVTGVTTESLENLIKFIYYGEIEIPQLEVNDFFATANKLKIKGVKNKNVEETPAPTTYDLSQAQKPISYDISKAQKPISQDIPIPIFSTNQKSSNSQVQNPFSQDTPIPIYSSNQQTPSSDQNVADESVVDVPDEISYDIKTEATNDVVDLVDNEKQEKEKDKNPDLTNMFIFNGLHWECAFCGKTSNSSSNIRLHVEIHVEGLSFTCDICQQKFKSRFLLYNHRARIHAKKNQKIGIYDALAKSQNANR